MVTDPISISPFPPGTVIQTLDYYPYGATRINAGTNSTLRQYIGQFADQSGLDYLNARYYDSVRGQFTTEDPVFWSSNQNLADPQSLNSYSYSEDNPITKKDPSGKQLTSAQSVQLNSLRSQLLGIQSQLSSSNLSSSQLSSIRGSINSAGYIVQQYSKGMPSSFVGTMSMSTPAYTWTGNPSVALSNTAIMAGTSFIPGVGEGEGAALGAELVVNTAEKAGVSDLAKSIASGHAAKHIEEFAEYGVTDSESFASHIDSVINDPESSFTGYNGQKYYWGNNTFVTTAPWIEGGGTAFVPDTGFNYYLNVFSNLRP